MTTSSNKHLGHVPGVLKTMLFNSFKKEEYYDEEEDEEEEEDEDTRKPKKKKKKKSLRDQFLLEEAGNNLIYKLISLINANLNQTLYLKTTTMPKKRKKRTSPKTATIKYSKSRRSRSASRPTSSTNIASCTIAWRRTLTKKKWPTT